MYGSYLPLYMMDVLFFLGEWLKRRREEWGLFLLLFFLWSCVGSVWFAVGKDEMEREEEGSNMRGLGCGGMDMGVVKGGRKGVHWVLCP